MEGRWCKIKSKKGRGEESLWEDEVTSLGAEGLQDE